MNQERARCWAVLPAAGTGSRMGGALPKQYMQVAGATLLEHSLRTLLDCAQISAVVVALHPQDGRATALPIFQDSRVHTVSGDQQRSGSVLAGLEHLQSIAAPRDWVLVHDAARPCLSAAMLDALFAELADDPVGGILAVPVADTIKRADANSASPPPNRATVCGRRRRRRCSATVNWKKRSKMKIR